MTLGSSVRPGYHEAGLLMARHKAERLGPDIGFCEQLLKSSELVIAPTWIVPVLVEHDNRARHDPILQICKDRFGRRIEIAIEVKQRDRTGVLFDESWKRLVKPALINVTFCAIRVS